MPQDLILHITYHKCLTLYYKRIIQRLTVEFPLAWINFGGDSVGLIREATEGYGKRILTLTDRDDIAWDALPAYRGSHFIRDPRDLIVSGYFYHLQTQEAWCRAADFPWRAFVSQPLFELVEPDPARRPRDISYQCMLNSLDRERGMILEMVFRRESIRQMASWDYRNPNVLELRYEDIIGNEIEMFSRLFEHYRFHRRLRERGLELATKFSLAKQSRAEGKHIRNGDLAQWKTVFSPWVKQVFKQAHGDVLIKLGYERDLDWE